MTVSIAADVASKDLSLKNDTHTTSVPLYSDLAETDSVDTVYSTILIDRLVYRDVEIEDPFTLQVILTISGDMTS